ncbi:hypothetical protein [Pedobacter sp.]|uniref:hypothetical protein n=1 Tax=Pedobacter sp. TaxID=1411316 RepID=UPI0031D92046
MIDQKKLDELAHKYPKDVVLYQQDLKTLMKLPGRIPGEFDLQLLDFLKITNGASILDYRFYGFKNILFTPSFDQNLKDKWYEWQHIAGVIVPFMGSSTNIGFGYLKEVTFKGGHPIVYFSEFPEDTSVVASGFDVFFNDFLYNVEASLAFGNNIEIDLDDWPFNVEKAKEKDPLLLEVLMSDVVKRTIDLIKKSW